MTQMSSMKICLVRFQEIFNPNLKKKQNEVKCSGAKIKFRAFQRDEDKFLDFLNHDCYWNHGAEELALLGLLDRFGKLISTCVSKY